MAALRTGGGQRFCGGCAHGVPSVLLALRACPSVVCIAAVRQRRLLCLLRRGFGQQSTAVWAPRGVRSRQPVGGGGGVNAPPLLWQRRLCMHSGAGCLCACNVAGVAASPLVWVPGTRPTCCGWVLRPQLRAIQISLLPCQNFQDGSTLSCCHWHFPFTSCERMGFDACHSIMYREPGRRHAAGNA